MDSEKNILVTATSIQMRAEIVSFSNNQLRGLLFNRFLDTPFEFVCFLQMIEKMEEIFDTKGFPEAFMTPRVFGASGYNSRKKLEVGGNTEMKDAMNSTTKSDPGSSKCTFEITVKFRQNATWQGQILWVDKNLKQNFRSVLEMLKLMDEAMTDCEEQQEAITWYDSE